MSMKFEAAVVTKKRSGEEFNTDSVNMNGKVPPREVILNGYKGAGTIDGKAYFALNSSFVEGYSDASVASFDDFASHFSETGANPVTVINEYFRNTVSALNSLNHLSKEISIGIAYCGNRNVILARSCDTSLYSYSNGILKKINPENSMHDDAKSNYGCYTIHDVSVDDIFILISPGAAASLTDKDITDICRVSDGSVKKIVNIVSRVAEAKPSVGGIGVIAIKILENNFVTEDDTEEIIPEVISSEETVVSEPIDNTDSAPELPREHEEIVGGFVSNFAIEDSVDLFEDSEDSVGTLVAGDNYDESQEVLAEEKPKKKSKKGLLILIIVALILIACALFGVAKFTSLFTLNNIETTIATTEAESTTVEETTEEETTEKETTEETTVEETTTESTTRYYYYYRSTTQPATSATTTLPNTTVAHTTIENTTKAREKKETTTNYESTTKSADSTTRQSITDASTDVPSSSEQVTSEESPVEDIDLVELDDTADTEEEIL